MISILIPVFNWDVTELITSLVDQLKFVNVPAEIILVDDGSDITYREANRKIANTRFIQYVELKKNIGRIGARQWLAAKATYDWLLFMDCDSTVVSDQFLKTYLDSITGAYEVVVGGRIYTTEKPSDCEVVLHWIYGSSRETIKPATSKNANRFMTNNFLIKKSLFERFNFAGGWKGYGYEDTWMGIQLDLMNTRVSYINNPARHDGLETSTIFITKTLEALMNLVTLASIIKTDALRKHVKLYDYYFRLRQWRLLWMVNVMYLVNKKSLSKNLRSCDPSLKQFDFYRLHYFTELMKNKYEVRSIK